jgi:hypothetical protein
MKFIFVIFFALQVLLSSTLAFAHMGVEIHDPHEAVHVHAGTDHDQNSSTIEPDHDDGPHFHLCAFTLNSLCEVLLFSPDSPATPYILQSTSRGASPPVPPPTA